MLTKTKQNASFEKQLNRQMRKESSNASSEKLCYPPDHWIHKVVAEMNKLDPENMPDTP